MEADEHDGEDDPTVLVDITASHSEYSVWRLGGRQTGQGQLDRLLTLPIAGVVNVARQSVVSAIHRACHHTTGVQLQVCL